MIQKRDPPSHQEYPASMMATLAYRAMSLQERGLLYSMRHECWVNEKLPKNPILLAKILGFDVGEITASLPAVMSFFDTKDEFIFSPELENYRAYLAAQRERMAAGGKKSAEAKKNKLLTEQAVSKDKHLASTLQAPSEAPCKVLVQHSTAKQSQKLLHEEDTTTYIDDIELYENCTAMEYEQTKG